MKMSMWKRMVRCLIPRNMSSFFCSAFGMPHLSTFWMIFLDLIFPSKSRGTKVRPTRAVIRANSRAVDDYAANEADTRSVRTRWDTESCSSVCRNILTFSNTPRKGKGFS